MNLYDAEDVIRDIETCYKAKLDAEIAIVNADKNDALVLESIPADKYLFETMNSTLLNYKGFWVSYGLIDTPIREVQADNFVQDVVVTFQVMTFDKGDKNRTNTLYKLLRYRRALEQVIIKNPDIFRGYAKPLMASLKPDAFPYPNKKVILSIGVDIKASITAN